MPTFEEFEGDVRKRRLECMLVGRRRDRVVATCAEIDGDLNSAESLRCIVVRARFQLKMLPGQRGLIARTRAFHGNVDRGFRFGWSVSLPLCAEAGIGDLAHAGRTIAGRQLLEFV